MLSPDIHVRASTVQAILIALRENAVPEMIVSRVMPVIHAGVLRDRKPTGRADARPQIPAAVSAVRADTVPAEAVRVTAGIPGAVQSVSKMIRAPAYPAVRTLIVRAARAIVIPDTR